MNQLERDKIEFKQYVNVALGNIGAWNKKVKGTKFIIKNNDSYSGKLLKIYRYANEHES
jgi:hypothetical protein